MFGCFVDHVLLLSRNDYIFIVLRFPAFSIFALSLQLIILFRLFHSPAYQYLMLLYRQCFCRDASHILCQLVPIRPSTARWMVLPHFHANDTLMSLRHANGRLKKVVLIAGPIEATGLDKYTSIQPSPSTTPARVADLNG